MSNQKLISELERHISLLVDDSETKVDDELLTIAINYLPDIPVDVRKGLIIKTYTAVLKSPNANDALIKFLQFLLEPVPLGAVLDIQPPVDLTAGLALENVSFHDMTLSILEKADQSSAERLATSYRPVFEALIALWFETPEVGVAERASSILANLLEIGGELLYKRIFRDKDIYDMLTDPESTIAQARLLHWVGSISHFAWPAIVTPHPKYSLLEYVSLKMVEYKHDVTMHQTLIRFYTMLLWSQRDQVSSNGKSPALEFLIEHKIHQELVDLFIADQEPGSDTRFILTDVSEYLSVFVSVHSTFFAANKPEVILSRMRETLANSSKQNHVDESAAIVRTCHLLQNIPRDILKAHLQGSVSSLLQSLDPHIDSPTIFETLGILFQGPLRSDVVLDESKPHPIPTDDPAQIAAAESLFDDFTYQQPLWLQATIAAADNLALPRVALAANAFLRLLVTARWNVLHKWFVFDPSYKLLDYLSSVPELRDVTEETNEVLRLRFKLVEALVKRAVAENATGFDSVKQRLRSGVAFKKIAVDVQTMGT